MARLDRLFLLREMLKRDFQARYAGSALGLVWSLLQPLWTLLLFTFVFSVVLRFRLVGQATENFAVFLFSGLLPWMAVNEGISRSATAITDNAALVKKMRFPAELLVMSIVLGALVHAGIAALIFLALLVSTGQFDPSGLAWLGLALPLQLALTLGLGLLLAALQVFFRDTAQIMAMLFAGWFYFTPIIYPLSQVPDIFRSFIALNPLTALVDLYRAALLGGELASLASTWPLMVAALLSLVLGYAFFRRLEPTFADEV